MIFKITDTSVRLIDAETLQLTTEWKEPAGVTISLAAANSTQILVATNGAKLYLLEVGHSMLSLLR